MDTQKPQSYRDLLVWQKSMDLVVFIYEITDKYPKHEIYGLTSQTRRCCISIPSNIAEGRLRGTRKDYRHFIITAFASGAELETQLEIGLRLKYSSQEDYSKAITQLSEIMRMLNKLAQTLNS